MAAKKRPTTTVGERSSGLVTRGAKSTAKPASKKAASTPKAAPRAPAAKKAVVREAPAPAKRAAPAALEASGLQPTAATLGEGDRAPRFELTDQQGQPLSSKGLQGSPYVLYFYPKNDTPGCTTEACGFRDAFPEFERLGVRVIGVSPDSVASHQKFRDKYGLPFTLLSDPEQKLASAYGVWGPKKNYGREYMGIVRSTFLVDGQGTIRKAWRAVRVNGHIADVQAAAERVS